VHLTDAEHDLLAHGELPPHDSARAVAHMARCDVCAGRRASLARDDLAIGGALRLLDGPIPAPDVDAVIATARRRGPSRWRIAAAAGALALAGAAAAMPGSPLRVLLERAATREPRVDIAARPAAPEPRAAVPTASGVEVPVGDSAIVLFEAEQSSGAIRITIERADALRVRALGGGPALAVRSSGVVVRNRGSAASYEVAMPAAATFVEVRVGDRIVFAKHGRAVTRAPAYHADGSWTLRFGR
jgi:hypothetical protein